MPISANGTASWRLRHTWWKSICGGGGERPSLPPLPDCDYYVFTSRYEARPRVGFWPIGVRDPLPVISVPLSGPDPPIELDLQQVLHQVYDSADYGKTIYAETPDPSLAMADLKWARQFTSAAE